MHHMDRQDVDERYQAIPLPIRALARENVLVYDYMNRYVNGQIITYDEFLHQCIFGLAENWERMKKDYLDYKLLTARPIIVPPTPPS